MAAIALSLAVIPAAEVERSGAAVGKLAVSGSALLLKPREPERAAPGRCPYARQGLVFYRFMHNKHRRVRGLETPWPPGRKPRNCADARWLAKVWRSNSYEQRVKTERWKSSRRRALRWDSEAAIRHVFGSYAEQALAVARCEAGSPPAVNATNGQYLGIFQMGSYARSRYGHGPDALTQARAAYRYFVDSGRDWSPWSCKP